MPLHAIWKFVTRSIFFGKHRKIRLYKSIACALRVTNPHLNCICFLYREIYFMTHTIYVIISNYSLISRCSLYDTIIIYNCILWTRFTAVII